MWGGKESQTPGEISEAELAEILAEQEALDGGEGDLDIETKFALLLYEALEENKKTGKKLGEGEDPEFPNKKDWAAFFAKMAKMGNKEKLGKKGLDEILKMMFRGLFNKKGKGKYLVGDLSYQKNGKNRTEKFAQMAVGEEFAKLLQQMKPGQTLSADKLRQLFGKELSFLLMAHVGEEARALAQGAEKNVIFNPKALIDPYSQARLENAIFSKRESQKSPKLSKESGLDQNAYAKHPQGVFANVYELMGLRKLYGGNPRLYTALTYLGMTAAAGLALAFTLFYFLK